MKRVIYLPHGGPGASFDMSDLIDHIRRSGRGYIIQAQQNVSFDKHPKPRSLDMWLRGKFARNRNTKQATNDVISQLTDTGYFKAGYFICPDSGRLCKGIKIVS